MTVYAFESGEPVDEAEALKAAAGGGTSGPMDPWQHTVETRLGELRADFRTMAADVGVIKTDIGTLKAKVADLPSKGFVVVALMGGMGVFAAVIAFADQVRKLVGLH